jgi:hypothetical protein
MATRNSNPPAAPLDTAGAVKREAQVCIRERFENEKRRFPWRTATVATTLRQMNTSHFLEPERPWALRFCEIAGNPGEFMATGNVEQLRAAIDRGATRDKVAANDPAVVPLGADDEAAGTPPEKHRVALAMENEIVSLPEQRSGIGFEMWAYAAFIVALVALFALSVH